MIPNFNFKLADVDFDVRYMTGFLMPREHWDWSNRIYSKYPKLRKLLKNKKIKREVQQILRKFIKEYKEKNKERIAKELNRLKSDWAKIGKKYIQTIEKILQTKWTFKNIDIYVSINPICPRFLKTKSFSLYFNKKDEAMETIAHELLHFIHFKKWKEVFLNADERTFESPHLIWALSEILAPIILNDSRIQKLLKHKATGYAEYHQNKINGKSIIAHFQELYNANPNLQFDEFLKLAYKEAEKHKKEILI